MKQSIEYIAAAIGAFLLISFVFSGARQMAYYGSNCEKLFIDKMEPVISTRWFCEVDPSKRINPAKARMCAGLGSSKDEALISYCRATE